MAIERHQKQSGCMGAREVLTKRLRLQKRSSAKHPPTHTSCPNKNRSGLITLSLSGSVRKPLGEIHFLHQRETNCVVRQGIFSPPSRLNQVSKPAAKPHRAAGTSHCCEGWGSRTAPTADRRVRQSAWPSNSRFNFSAGHEPS